MWSVGTRNAVVTAEVNTLPDDMRAKLRRIGEMPVFETEYGRAPRITGNLALEQDVLWGYRRTRVPLGIWHALRRMSAWIEPERDTGFVRAIALRQVARGQTVRCVWSGKTLGTSGLDIDHCLPWAAWPCSDLWNLLPAAPAVNCHVKREKIVTGAALARARPLILN